MQEHLVAFEYGGGTVWAFVLAPSRDAIAEYVPEVDVHDEPPSWMTEQDLARLRKYSSIELNGEHCLEQILHGPKIVAAAG